MTRRLLLACLVLSACADGASGPIELRLGEDACAYCRMTIVSQRTAAQIVAPGAEPLIFDELGCLRDYLGGHAVEAGTQVFVADHVSGAWIDARQATFTRTEATTPMSSGLIAHANRESRDADPAAAHGVPVPPPAILGRIAESTP
jgi:copper chaperone NosL